jgi:hypothetical protein
MNKNVNKRLIKKNKISSGIIFGEFKLKSFYKEKIIVYDFEVTTSKKYICANQTKF